MVMDDIFQTTKLLVGDWAERIETPAPNRMDVYMRHADDLVAAVAGMRVKRLGYLAAITGLDPGNDSDQLEVLYHFCTGPFNITLRVQIPKDDCVVSSLCELIPSAEPFERELSEMFGVKVNGLRNPERLYLSDDWPDGVYPLRKDFDAEAVLSNSSW
jgi:Ni,Fe-hydrogenase III component G